VRRLVGSSVVAVLFLAVVGCPPPKNSAQAPAAAPAPQPAPYTATAPPQSAPPPGYAQQPPPGYAQQPAPPPGYAQPQPQPAPAAPGAAPAPSASAPLATPGPLALPCQNDQACGLAHCNTQYGKCAFPCQTAADCITGATCNTMTGFCLPGG
jgi:hypothetical protein